MAIAVAPLLALVFLRMGPLHQRGLLVAPATADLVRLALQRARNGSYRPKTVNGEPVASTGVIHFSS